MATFHPLLVKNILKVTELSVAITFEIPEHLKATFRFKAGQYLTLEATINDKKVRRAYSICSSTSSGELQVAIKAIPNGVFSNYAVSVLKVGNTIDVAVPEGKFLLAPQPYKNYIAFAAGSGITPILAMIKTVLETESTANFTLIYGNKSIADTMFYDVFSVLSSQYSDRFKVHYVFSRERNDAALFGRIDKGTTNYYLKNTYANVSYDAAFICGPESMIETVSAVLKDNNFAKEKIHFELFTASISEENTANIKDGETQVTVLLDDETETFTMPQTDDLLSASLRNNIDAPYSCQGGVCSSCLAKVTEGNAVMVKNSILTDGEVADGLILTCQAYPTTPSISIDFDDV